MSVILQFVWSCCQSSNYLSSCATKPTKLQHIFT
ncbi:hypothetical protein FQN60_018346 [Etheostoma spectabile]|uniref:Uncharacterized protein n=1 Tax=Etheostoma spectabile TaxID=54343 RepID=A0A5J5DHY5_9PERO|nr:hypothetical protein FQN60_018346 [Etheostoma spectabile]